MVEIEEIEENESRSSARLKDAEEVESLLSSVTRQTVKMELTALTKRLRKDSQALKRMETSQKAKDKEISEDKTDEKTTTDDEEKPIVEEVKTEKKKEPPTTDIPTTKQEPALSPAKPHITLSSAKYIPINTFAFDSGKYNSPTITIYVSLEGVKKIPRDQIKCDFTPTSFDLIVSDLNGKSYRLYKDNLAHDIDPSTSKIVVKVDRLIIKLGKVKGEYGYDTWTDLVDKKKKKATSDKKEDPHSSIMNLMKDLYETGDDNMRKVIGETMEKQRRGDLGKDSPPSLGDM